MLMHSILARQMLQFHFSTWSSIDPDSAYPALIVHLFAVPLPALFRVLNPVSPSFLVPSPLYTPLLFSLNLLKRRKGKSLEEQSWRTRRWEKKYVEGLGKAWRKRNEWNGKEKKDKGLFVTKTSSIFFFSYPMLLAFSLCFVYIFIF